MLQVNNLQSIFGESASEIESCGHSARYGTIVPGQLKVLPGSGPGKKASEALNVSKRLPFRSVAVLFCDALSPC